MINHQICVLKEMIDNWHDILNSYKNRSGFRYIAMTNDLLPQEILTAAGIIPLIFNTFAEESCDSIDYIDKLSNDPLFDYIIALKSQAYSRDQSDRIIHYQPPCGYSDETLAKLHESIDQLLKITTDREIQSIDSHSLRASSEEYSAVRSLLRGIIHARISKPSILSHSDISVLIKLSMIFPPVITIGYLDDIFKKMNQADADAADESPRAILHSGMIEDWGLVDRIEDAGVRIIDYDTCRCGRFYDLSYRLGAKDLISEILDAFRYRPLCSAVKSPEDRFDLIYSQCKNHGIESVIFLKQNLCRAKLREIDYLRIQLMRKGIDPVILDPDDAVSKTIDHMSKARIIITSRASSYNRA